MPRSKDGKGARATREAILGAAESVFADKGFAGTTLREVAEASGASVPLIVFHFKDKQGLYRAVKAAIMGRYTDGPGAPAFEGKGFLEFLGDMIRSMFAFYRDNPSMIRLGNWTRLEGDLDPWPGEDEWHHAYLDRIREAQARGEIRDDLDPMNISIMICGSIHIWWEYHSHFLKHAEAGAPDADADERYARQLLAFVSRGLGLENILQSLNPPKGASE